MIVAMCNDNEKKEREREEKRRRGKKKEREKREEKKKGTHVRIFLLRERKDYRRGAVTMFDSHKRLGD